MDTVTELKNQHIEQGERPLANKLTVVEGYPGESSVSRNPGKDTCGSSHRYAHESDEPGGHW